ncbi:NAD(P)H-quinone oxidoreductase subunit 3 chloroplastic [Bienertia sinuspersici]
MFLLYEYDIYRKFLIISSVIPILAFLLSGILAPSSKGPMKLSSYKSGIEPLGVLGYNFEAVIICLL